MSINQCQCQVPVQVTTRTCKVSKDNPQVSCRDVPDAVISICMVVLRFEDEMFGFGVDDHASAVTLNHNLQH